MNINNSEVMDITCLPEKHVNKLSGKVSGRVDISKIDCVSSRGQGHTNS